MEALIALALSDDTRAKRRFMRNFRKLPIETQTRMNRIMNMLIASVENSPEVEPKIQH